MPLETDFQEFRNNNPELMGDEALRGYFSTMWKETEISTRPFRNIGFLDAQEISDIVDELIQRCDGTPFRKSLYQRRWRNLNEQILQEWLSNLECRIRPDEQKEYLAVYVTRVLRGKLEPCNNEDVGTILRQRQSVWRLEFERLSGYCNQQGI